MTGTRSAAVAWLACLLVALFLQGPAFAKNGQEELRREKARLLEMKAREEKTAAELSDALRKEKLTKERVSELRGRLNRQRGVITGIDRRLSVLGGRLNATEKEVRKISEAQGEARRSLRQEALLAFEGHRAGFALPAERSSSERARYLMRGFIGADLKDEERLSRERKRKEAELSGIEKQVEISERKMARAQEEGEKLLSEPRGGAETAFRHREGETGEAEGASRASREDRPDGIARRPRGAGREGKGTAPQEEGGGGGREGRQNPRRRPSRRGGSLPWGAGCPPRFRGTSSAASGGSTTPRST